MLPWCLELSSLWIPCSAEEKVGLFSLGMGDCGEEAPCTFLMADTVPIFTLSIFPPQCHHHQRGLFSPHNVISSWVALLQDQDTSLLQAVADGCPCSLLLKGIEGKRAKC